MSQAPAFSQAPSPQQAATFDRLRLSNVDWRDYSRFLFLFGERPGYRLTYDRGELEIMSPLLEHDSNDRILGRLVVALTEELGLPIRSGGTTTIRRRRRRRGLEPDDCYWIANAHRMAGRRRLDLRRDPPPDLAIEVDVTRSSLDRLSVYASLGVPEVWRLDGDVLTFYLLQPSGGYAQATNSQSFPFLTPADLVPFLQQGQQAQDENDVIRSFRAWVRQRQPLPPP
jgi:Uma2 family endonuclease